MGVTLNEGSYQQHVLPQNNHLKSSLDDLESFSFNFDKETGKLMETDLNARLAEICQEQEQMFSKSNTKDSQPGGTN